MGALKLKNTWLLADSDTAGEGDWVALSVTSSAYLIVYGDFTSVQIQIMASDGTTWVNAEQGLFETPEARLFKGIPKSFAIRCFITGGTSTSVELRTSGVYGSILKEGFSGEPLTMDNINLTMDSLFVTMDQTEI